jgi:hypothetical protein
LEETEMPEVAAAAIMGGASIYGAKKSGDANKKASQVQGKAADDALIYQKEQDLKAEARQREIDAKLEAQWNAQEARKAPLRALQDQLIGQTAGRMGLNLGSLGGASRPSSMPTGWSPNTGVNVPRGTLGSLAGYQPEMSEQELPEGYTIQDILADRWGSRAR